MSDTQFILDFTALTTIQDVVNQLIASLGEAPVASIDPSPSTDVDLALVAINEADKQVQRKGWAWNREYALPLTIATDGTVPLPDNTLRVTKAYMAPSYNASPPKIIARGLKIYNATDHTYIFTTAAPIVDTIARLDWDLIPDAFRGWIGYLALQKFQARVQQSAIVLQLNPQDLADARATAEQYEDEEAQTNAIDGNLNVVTGLYGTAGMRRNRGGS